MPTQGGLVSQLPLRAAEAGKTQGAGTKTAGVFHQWGEGAGLLYTDSRPSSTESASKLHLEVSSIGRAQTSSSTDLPDWQKQRVTALSVDGTGSHRHAHHTLLGQVGGDCHYNHFRERIITSWDSHEMLSRRTQQLLSQICTHPLLSWTHVSGNRDNSVCSN